MVLVVIAVVVMVAVPGVGPFLGVLILAWAGWIWWRARQVTDRTSATTGAAQKHQPLVPKRFRGDLGAWVPAPASDAASEEPPAQSPVFLPDLPEGSMRLSTRGRLKVVGENHHAAELRAVVGRRRLALAPAFDEAWKVPARLVCEPHNPHDRNAVRVELPGQGRWQHVGYVSAGDAADYSRVLAGVGGIAVTVAGVVGHAERGRTPGVFLHLAGADECLMGNALPEDARVLWPDRQCAVTGEQHHQGALQAGLAAAVGRQLWFTLAPGEVAAGKYTGAPTIEVRLDGHRVGELTASQGGRYGASLFQYLGQPRPVACEGLVTQGAKKLEVTIFLPRVD